MEQVEKEVILKAFKFYESEMVLTAKSLGICRKTLSGKLKKYKVEGIAPEDDFVIRKAGRPKQVKDEVSEESEGEEITSDTRDAG